MIIRILIIFRLWGKHRQHHHNHHLIHLHTVQTFLKTIKNACRVQDPWLASPALSQTEFTQPRLLKTQASPLEIARTLLKTGTTWRLGSWVV